MQNIGLLDYLLLPFYIYLFLRILRKKTSTYNSQLLKFFFIAFGLRMLGSITYSLMVQYYYGYGDSFTYFYGSKYLTQKILEDFSNVKYFFTSTEDFAASYNQDIGDINYAGYFEITSAATVMKISSFVSLFSFNCFLIISIFFGLFSFWGQWKLFLVFADIQQNKNLKTLAFLVLFTPSIWFWGSGLMKDSLTLGGLGMIVSIFYNGMKEKKVSILSILILFANIYLVYLLKNYIIVIFGIGCFAFVFIKIYKVINNIVLRAFFSLTLMALLLLSFLAFDVSSQINQIIEDGHQQITSFQNNYSNVNFEDDRSAGQLEYNEVKNGLSGIILQAPIAIFTCLFRPFIWESKKIMVLFTSLESLFLLFCFLFILFKMGIVKLLTLLFKNEYLFFSLTISILFALIIGFTTFNFGTIIRYKVILLPFLYFIISYIYTKIKESEY